MVKAIFLILGLFLILSCNNSSKEDANSLSELSTLKNGDSLPSDLTYKIIKESTNNALGKCNLDVELNRKISERELAILANELRKPRMSYDQLWIFYTFQNMNIGSGAWATTHFTPELEVKILGSTVKEEKTAKTQTSKIDGKVLGKWYEQQYTSASYILYEKDGKIFLKASYKDGTSNNDEMTRKKVSDGYRLDYKEYQHGEYFIMVLNGELRFYNKDGKNFTSAQVTK